MLNQIILQGRLTKDPEIRYTQSQTPVTTITLAVERDFVQKGDARQTDFVDVVAWSKTAEFVHGNFTKGQLALVTGRLQSRDWTDKDGNKRRQWEVVADRVHFCGKKETQADEPKGFTEMNDTEEKLPF